MIWGGAQLGSEEGEGKAKRRSSFQENSPHRDCCCCVEYGHCCEVVRCVTDIAILFGGSKQNVSQWYLPSPSMKPPNSLPLSSILSLTSSLLLRLQICWFNPNLPRSPESSWNKKISFKFEPKYLQRLPC
jgi:hypothetical protein